MVGALLQKTRPCLPSNREDLLFEFECEMWPEMMERENMSWICKWFWATGVGFLEQIRLNRSSPPQTWNK